MRPAVLFFPLFLLGCATSAESALAPVAPRAARRSPAEPRPVAQRHEAAAARPALAKSGPEAVETGAGSAHSSLESSVEASTAASFATLALRTAAERALDEPGRGRCPSDMALVDDRICVDRWEGSLVERTPRGERAWSPFVPVDGHELSVRAVSRAGVVPQGYISGQQAQLACLASGKRLCRASEWERACRGPDDTTFPYGNVRRVGVCNDDVRSVHPVAEVAVQVGLAPDRWWRDGMNQPLINQLPDSLLATGARAGCTNGYGVFDMVGNLHEWIDDPEGTFRGGYYMDTTKNGDGCDYHTTGHDFRYHDYSTGFRCCMDADRIE